MGNIFLIVDLKSLQNKRSIYNLLKDINYLYVTTKDKRVESLFVKIAQSAQSDLASTVDWIRDILKSNRQGDLGITRAETFDTILHLLSLRKSYPTGFSIPEFSKAILNDPKFKFYVPMMVLLRKAQEQRQYRILKPFEDILNSSQNATVGNQDPNMFSQIRTDLEILEDDYVEYNRSPATVMKPFEDRVQKRRVTKKEQVANLVDYLSKRFASEISGAFEQIKFIDPAGISAEPSLLKDPVTLITKLFPNYTKNDINYAVYIAKNIIKEIRGRVEPVYYNDVYNYIRNRAFVATRQMSTEEFNTYLYRRNLELGEVRKIDNDNDGDSEIPDEETILHPIQPKTWINPDTVIIVSSVLYLLNSNNA